MLLLVLNLVFEIQFIGSKGGFPPNGKAQHRSPPKQIEYWARIGQIADENPELPLSFIKGILVGVEERKASDVSEYEFG